MNEPEIRKADVSTELELLVSITANFTRFFFVVSKTFCTFAIGLGEKS